MSREKCAGLGRTVLSDVKKHYYTESGGANAMPCNQIHYTWCI